MLLEQRFKTQQDGNEWGQKCGEDLRHVCSSWRSIRRSPFLWNSSINALVFQSSSFLVLTTIPSKDIFLILACNQFLDDFCFQELIDVYHYY